MFEGHGARRRWRERSRPVAPAHRSAVEQSLRRFQTDHLDVYYAHHPDASVPIDETIRAFDDLVRQGKLRYYALRLPGMASRRCTLESRQDRRERSCVPAGAVQSRAERSGARHCADLPRKLSFLDGLQPVGRRPPCGPFEAKRRIRGPAAVGRNNLHPREIALAEELERLAALHGYAPAILALAWLISQPAVASAIIGAEDIRELEIGTSATISSSRPK